MRADSPAICSSNGMNASDNPTVTAMVGAGTMGRGIAHAMAAHGIVCRISDASPAAAHAARDAIIATARAYVPDGLLDSATADRIEANVVASESLEAAVTEATLVFEAVPEDPDVKHPILARIETALGPDGIIATNTSAIPIRQLAARLDHPERFLGVHWFNPAQWVPGVEVIRGPSTADAVVDTVMSTLRAAGKRPAEAGDAAGFVANRIQFAMFAEAASVVADGVATAEQVDEIVRGTFGFRLPFFGPFAIGDLAGLDVYAGVYRSLREAFGGRFDTPPLVLEMVEQGRLGHKSGRGMLDWAAGDSADLTAQRDRAFAALAALVKRSDDQA